MNSLAFVFSAVFLKFSIVSLGLRGGKGQDPWVFGVVILFFYLNTKEKRIRDRVWDTSFCSAPGEDAWINAAHVAHRDAVRVLHQIPRLVQLRRGLWPSECR